MIENIVNCTNNQVEVVGKNYSRKIYASETDREEIEFLIAMLHLPGENKTGRHN